MWDAQSIGRLKEMMANGHSMGEAAKELHTTRNAVCGYCNRHGIRNHNSRERKPKLARVPKFKPKHPLLFTEPDVEPTYMPLNIPLLLTVRAHCRWPTGQDDDGVWSLCCGHKVTHGRYCQHHYDMSFRAVQPRANVRPSYGR
jgi:hypothetical protein